MRGWRPSAPTLLLLPAVVVLAAVVVVPLLLSFYSTFTPFRLTKPDTFWIFIGTRNYWNILTNWDFWVAFARTVVLLTVALNLEMLIGLGLALLVPTLLLGLLLVRRAPAPVPAN